MTPELTRFVFYLVTQGAMALGALVMLAALWLGFGSWNADGRPLGRRWSFRICKWTWLLWSVGALAVCLFSPSGGLPGGERINETGWLLWATLVATWSAFASGGLLVFILACAGTGVWMRAACELLIAGAKKAIQRVDPVRVAVALAVLVCLGRLWLGPS